MAQYNWKEYENIKSINGFNSIKWSYNGLTSLLSHICLKNELIIFKAVLKRITIRLRNAKVSQLIKQTNKCFDHLFELNLSEVLNQNISTLVEENYETSSGYILLPFKYQIESVMETLVKSAHFLRKIIFNSFNSFSNCMTWIRLGHLAPHFLVMSSSLSRLNIISKAIMVYVNDLYSGLNLIKDELKERYLMHNSKSNSLPNSLQTYLLDLNIKCDSNINKLIKSKVQDNDEINKIEDIGVPINRTEDSNEFQSNKSNKKRKRNKKKNKNEFNAKKTKLEKAKTKKFFNRKIKN